MADMSAGFSRNEHLSMCAYAGPPPAKKESTFESINFTLRKRHTNFQLEIRKIELGKMLANTTWSSRADQLVLLWKHTINRGREVNYLVEYYYY